MYSNVVYATPADLNLLLALIFLYYTLISNPPSLELSNKPVSVSCLSPTPQPCCLLNNSQSSAYCLLPMYIATHLTK